MYKIKYTQQITTDWRRRRRLRYNIKNNTKNSLIHKRKIVNENNNFHTLCTIFTSNESSEWVREGGGELLSQGILRHMTIDVFFFVGAFHWLKIAETLWPFSLSLFNCAEKLFSLSFSISNDSSYLKGTKIYMSGLFF